MRGMMPYLHMKKVIVQDHVRYFTLFPKMPSCENHVPNWDLLADRRSGMSLKEISAKRGIAFENVSKRLRKIEIRTGVKIQLAA